MLHLHMGTQILAGFQVHELLPQNNSVSSVLSLCLGTLIWSCVQLHCHPLRTGFKQECTHEKMSASTCILITVFQSKHPVCCSCEMRGI